MKHLFKFRGRYGRIGTVIKDIDICTICNKEKEVLKFDASEDEYTVIAICKSCCDFLWKD